MAYLSTRRKRRSGRRKRNLKRRRTGRKTGSVRLMRTVARRVALNLAETKRFGLINLVSPNPTGTGRNQFWYTSPFFSLVNGTASGDIVGAEIQNVLLKMNFRVQIPWSLLWTAASPVGSNYGTVSLMVALIATNEDSIGSATWTSFNPLFTPFFWMYQTDMDKPLFNGHNVKVLKQWKRTVTPDQLSAAPTANTSVQIIKGKIRHRFRKIRYEDTGTVPAIGAPPRASYTRGWNYHIIYGYGMRNTSSNLGDHPQIASDTYLYYKDP